MKYSAGLVAILAFAALRVAALDSATITETSFNEKINTWVEGTVAAVDAPNLKVTIHGAKDKYATEYARMMRDIQTKTRKLTGPERDAKEAEIRKSYNNALAKAASAKRDTESDFALYLPSKDAQFMLYDESKFYGQEFNVQTFQERIEGRTAGLTDLQIGEHVAAGFESGIVANHLYAIIRNRSGSSVGSREAINTGFSDKTNPKPDNTAVNARDRHPNEVTADQQGENPGDRKITQDIRAAIVKDGTLSTYAHNIKIITLNGQVTLKGPVKSEEEKQSVEKTARSVAGERVVNGLDVTK